LDHRDRFPLFWRRDRRLVERPSVTVTLHEENDAGDGQDHNDEQQDEPERMVMSVSSGQQGHCPGNGDAHYRSPAGS
jgi:hypothetical protein